MYRQHENPTMLEELLDRLDIDMQDAIAHNDEDRQISIAEEIAEVRDRLNIAWQDNEALNDAD